MGDDVNGNPIMFNVVKYNLSVNPIYYSAVLLFKYYCMSEILE